VPAPSVLLALPGMPAPVPVGGELASEGLVKRDGWTISAVCGSIASVTELAAPGAEDASIDGSGCEAGMSKCRPWARAA